MFGKIFVGLCGLGFIALLGNFAWKQGWFKVAPIEFQLARSSTEEVLFQRIEGAVSNQLQSWQGVWLWKANLEEIHASVVQDPRVQAVSVSRVFPNRIRVTVQPHKPVFGLLDTKGRFHPVAADGSLLPALAATEVPDFPLLRGLQFFDDENLRRDAVRLFKELPDEGAFSKLNLSELRHSKREGFRMFLMEPSVQVLVGEGDIGLKASRIEQVLHYLESRHIKGRVIDARLSQKVVVRVRNEP